MKAPRALTSAVQFALDQLLPPIVRDSKLLTWAPFLLAFGRKAELVRRFKDRAPLMNAAEFAGVYREIGDVSVQRETDLNAACVAAIERSVAGETVLEAGCGAGYLARRLAGRFKVTALDIAAGPELARTLPHVRLVKASVEQLPFPDAAFDTVISTHTLEHVLDLPRAVAELRRVTRRRLVVVVPRQRPYRYTFDLHLHFFPYPHSLLAAMRPRAGRARCEELGGDLLYVEDLGLSECRVERPLEAVCGGLARTVRGGVFVKDPRSGAEESQIHPCTRCRRRRSRAT